jgi:biopolymer transport protein ExbB
VKNGSVVVCGFLTAKLKYFLQLIIINQEYYMFSFIQLQADTLANAASNVVIQKVATTNEISVLGFILKGGFFLIPIAILLFYTFYVIIERYLFINKRSKVDPLLMRDVRDHLTSGNFELARTITERTDTASGNVIKEGILLIGRPIAEIESNMDRAADIEIAEMEQHLGQLGLIAGIAPTLGFIGTISGVIKIFYSISVTENISIGNISGGLYEKMISSGSGLIVGIIAYSAYHLLNGKIDNYALKVQKQILEFVNIIQKA